MRTRLKLELRPGEGALLRTLGLVERRGYRVLGVHTTDQEGSTRVRLEVDPEGRSIELLLRQLQQLVDVELAEVSR